MSMSAPPGLYRCPTCKSTSGNPKNLVIFIDGTSNKPSPKKTNVVKLYDIISDGEVSGVKQSKKYLEGVGVYEAEHSPSPSRIDSAIEVLFACNVGRNVKNAYRWLVEIYEQGDQIYLFGFSRGAYQVRALAAMIHEVGLLKKSEGSEERIEQAYRHYLSINPNHPETRNETKKFKERFCWQGVRIHFMGVWDTVSSLGFIRRDVYITASASVTNSCHFRHALALDERRVHFMPEYFKEVNPHNSNYGTRRSAASDVKEVWFAGCHSDVGGMDTGRPQVEPVHDPVNADHTISDPVHAGNVPLLWMSREAIAQGLVFDWKVFDWGPSDVDRGREYSMTPPWKIFEFMPFRYQVSFSGTGRYARRLHLADPRLVIPGQDIHPSAFPGDLYAPRATLVYGIDIPTVPQIASGGLGTTKPWTTELLEEGASLTSLLNNQQTALKFLGEVLLLLHFRMCNTQTIPTPSWSEASIPNTPAFDQFALTVIYDITSNYSTSQRPLEDARGYLSNILPSPDRPEFPRTLYILRFLARHQNLRQRFIAHVGVIQALMHTLGEIAESRCKDLFPLVVDSLCYLIDDNDQQADVIGRLTTALDETGEKTRLSSTLEMKVTSHLMASLKMVASIARQQPDRCRGLQPRITSLAKKGGSPVGSAAVEVLVALNEPLPNNIHFSSILSYLSSTLPLLDVEVDTTSPPNNTSVSPPDDADTALPNDTNTAPPNDTGFLPTVLGVNRPDGHRGLNEEIMNKLLRTIESRNAHKRTAATLTLLKLCSYPIIRDFCSRGNTMSILVGQLEQEQTSLLAVYALKTCLRLDMWNPGDWPCVAQLVVAMFDKGWFDGAVGRVGGFKIFDELMACDELRRQVIENNIVSSLTKKLAGGEHHGVRMSLLCLEILGPELTNIVANSVTWLKDENKAVQKRGIKILSALARTAAGEQAIRPHLIEIVKMLLPDGLLPVPRSQLFGATSVVYNLCRNENLREQILQSGEYIQFTHLRHDKKLYPQT